MLDITIRVTESSTHLKQIHHMGVVNLGTRQGKTGVYDYKVYVDGTPLVGVLQHRREDGALRLAASAANKAAEFLAGVARV